MDTKGNKGLAFGILLGTILTALFLFKPIMSAFIAIIAWLLGGILALVLITVLIVAGYALYLIEAWAAKTLFTNHAPDFPDFSEFKELGGSSDELP